MEAELARQRLAFTRSVFAQENVKDNRNEWLDELWQGIISEIPIAVS
jgi:hypothetical protein